MELMVNRKGNRIFTFDGTLGEQVWQPEPITSFRFKTAPDNEWLREHLAANYPVCGVVFEGVPYVGTNDGCIYTPDRKIQRIPEIFVDPKVFFDEYHFTDEAERKAFEEFKKRGRLNLRDRSLIVSPNAINHY
jgi:hypothetical protein